MAHLWECKVIFKLSRIRQNQKRKCIGTSLAVQWLRIHLPMQGTWVQSLAWEDPTWHRATKTERHNSEALALEPGGCNCWAHTLQLLKPACPRAHAPQQQKTPQWGAHALLLESSFCSPQLEKACAQQQRLSAAKSKWINFKRRKCLRGESNPWKWSEVKVA